MQVEPSQRGGWKAVPSATGLPGPLDCETLTLLRSFLAPLLERSQSWDALVKALREKGYGIAFREGHLVILNDRGTPLCTGRMLGVPLAQLSRRLGRPTLRLLPGGRAATLR